MPKTFGKAFIAFAVIFTLILTSSATVMARTYTEDEITVLLAEDFDSLYSSNMQLLNNDTTVSGWGYVPGGNYGGNNDKWFVNVYLRGDSTGKVGSSATITKNAEKPFVFNYNHHASSTVYYNPVITRKIDTSAKGLGSSYPLPKEGVLSVSAKIKIPDGVSGLDFPKNAVIFAIAGDDAVYKDTDQYAQTIAVPGNTCFYHALKLDADGNIVPHNFSVKDFALEPGVWHEITFIYDLSLTKAGVKNNCTIKVNTEGEDETKAWTGVILNSDAKELDALYGLTISMGTSSVQAGGTLGNGTVYYDDFMVNLLPPYDPFVPQITTDDVIDVNPEFTMAFGDEVTTNDEEELISLIAKKLTLTDANGKKVNITCTPDGESAVIKVNETLKYNTTYTFTCPEIPGFANQDFLAFSGFEYSFTTKFAKGIYIDKDTVDLSCGDDISSAEKISLELGISNPELQKGNFVLCAAAYKEDTSLAGYKLTELEVDDEAALDVEVEEFLVSDADYVVLYLWDTDEETGAINALMHEPVVINPMDTELLYSESKTDSLEFKISDAVNKIFEASGKNADVTGVNNYATFILLEDGVELKDIDDTNIKALRAVNMTNDGYFSTKFGADLVLGDYILYAFGDSWSDVTAPFGYVSVEDVEGFIDDVKDGTIKTDDLYNQTMIYNNGIGVDKKAFDTEKKQKNFNYRVDKKRSEITGETALDKLASFVEITDFATKEVVFVEKVENTVYQSIEALLHENAYLMGTTKEEIGSIPNSIADKFVGETFDNADDILTFLKKKIKDAKDKDKGKDEGNKTGRQPSKVSSVSVAPVVVPQKYEAPFTDMTEFAWAKDAVDELTKRKVVAGIDEETFNPGGIVTREQFVKMLVIASQSYKADAQCSFEDVDNTAWFYTYVASAKAAGLVNGISETEFGTSKPITRQDMAVMIYNALKASFDGTDIKFADADSVSDYAKNAVAYLTENGYINGKTKDTFAPMDLSTRAEAAVMIYRFITK